MTNLTVGATALPFELPAVDGKTYAYNDFADKQAVVVVFSCNHCPYVLAWEDRLVEIQAEYGPRGVQVLAINANDAERYPTDSFEKMQAHAAEKGYNFPYLHDESQAVARAYGAERTPEVFVFDQAGVLHYHGLIDDNHENPDQVQNAYLRNALDAILTGQNPPVTNTDPKGCTIKWK